MIVQLTESERSQVIDSYDQLYGILGRILSMEEPTGRMLEHFWVIGFEAIGRIKYLELVALGGMNIVHIDALDVFRLAVLFGCKRMIIAHNHPSGSLEFSKADKELTFRLVLAGSHLGVDVMDHLVVNEEGKGRHHLGGEMAPPPPKKPRRKG